MLLVRDECVCHCKNYFGRQLISFTCDFLCSTKIFCIVFSVGQANRSEMCVTTSYVCDDCGMELSSDFKSCNDKDCRGETVETKDSGSRCETCLKLFWGSDSDDSDSDDDDNDYKF